MDNDKMKKKVILAVILVILATFLLLGSRISEEKKVLKSNISILLSDVEKYRISDSLNGAKAEALTLQVKDYERVREEDARIIKELRIRNKQLADVASAGMSTEMEVKQEMRDTIILRDSVILPAKAFDIHDKWYDMQGIVTDDVFEGDLSVRDSLLLVRSVQYKRFLFWKTKKIKDEQYDIISKNPYTTIEGFEVIRLEK